MFSSLAPVVSVYSEYTAQIAVDQARFFRTASIDIEPVTEEQAHVARQAWSDFGKGRHAAGLNFGDCFSYALAKVSGEPLLFKGQDFRKTGISAAL
jgi:ribonuclease VapC